MWSLNKTKKIISTTLCAALIIPLLYTPAPVRAAADKTLILQQAQSLALAKSPDITKLSSEILLKQMKYIEAVKGIQAKEQDLKSSRWSPLLSFKSPQQLNLSQEYDLTVKPLTLQAEIDTLKHQLGDMRYQVTASVDKLYSKLYVSQEKISFDQDRLSKAKDELSQNNARLITGTASQNDVNKMSTAVDKLTTELSTLERGFASDKGSLTDMIGLDVSSGYVFRNSLETSSIPRESLDSIVSYALQNDETCYEAGMKASAALLNVKSYYDLMRNQYGAKMDCIADYVSMTEQGVDVDESAFKTQYDAMLKTLDQPWNGNVNMLSFSFSKDSFKGDISGTRYMEDNMYALYTACMDYVSAKTSKDSAEKDFRAKAASSYETLVTAYNAYAGAIKSSDAAGKSLDKVSALQKLGKADESELKDARDSYQEQQLDMIDSLYSYNTLLYDFDRLTCGAVTKYLSGADMSTNTGSFGDSFSTVDPIKDPYYYIYSSVSNLAFSIGVNIPKNYNPQITKFEVWMDGTEIGSRTEVGNEVRHLALDYKDNSKMTIKLYNGDDFVAQCDIDASVPRAVLPIKSNDGASQKQEIEVGTYSVETTQIGSVSTSTLTLKLNGKLNAKTFSISYGDHGNIYSSNKLDIDKSLTYLTLLVASLKDVTLNLYNDSGALAATGRFDTTAQKLYATPVA